MKATITLNIDGDLEGPNLERLHQAITEASGRLSGFGTVEHAIRTGARQAPGPTGGKGLAIQQAREEHPDWSRKQIAEHVGCTVQRVGEVFRALGIVTERPARAAAPAATAAPETPSEPEPERNEEPEPTPTPDLASLSVNELRDLAKERGITGRHEMNKTQLLIALS
jgi:pyruvate/2-oxoglutarate dehydrogenase complex dihydrolipoamide acyltransferase (E2) component